jgi:ankyrin repeat protein
MRLVVFWIAAILSSGSSWADDATDCSNWLSAAYFETADVQSVRTCLKNRSALERDEAGRTPLHLAVSSTRDSVVVAELLHHGADLSLSDGAGRKPIHVATLHAQAPEILSVLLAWGADIEAELPGGGSCPRAWTNPLPGQCATLPIHLASQREDGFPFMATLLGAGADPNQRDGEGLTPLHRVAARGESLSVQMLLSRRAETNARDLRGRTPLHHAVATPGKRETVSSLIQAGANLDKVDSEGQTPLHYAVRRSERVTDIIALLLGAGASVDVGDSDGTTPPDVGRAQVQRKR